MEKRFYIQSMRNNWWIGLIVALIIGGFVGWGIATTQANTVPNRVAGVSSSSPENTAFNTKATDLRLMLNVLLREHAVLGATDLVSVYRGEDTTRLDELMNDNANQLGVVIQNAYGTSTRNTFMQLWTAHMQEYKSYTLARKSNNTTQMNTARQNLQNIANQLGTLLGKTSNNLNASTVTSLMQNHINDTLGIVDATAANDLTQKANLMKQGYDQAGQFADTLAKGILLDKPNLFQ